MFTYSIAGLFLALHLSSGFNIIGKDVPDVCRQGHQYMGYGAHRAFLEAHNNRRALLAEGKVETKPGETLPEAANMRFMAYDCDLEEEATKLTPNCKEFPSETQFNKTRTNFAKIASRINNGGITIAEEAVSEWWNKKSEWNNPMKITEADVSAILFFLVAQAKTDRFGCSVNYCPNGDNSYYNIACIYGRRVKVGKRLYQKGTPCSNCTEGYKQYRNVLCKEP